jgi:hypothetical protein
MPLYQDDLDTSDSVVDAITNEETDDPTQTLQIPPEKFKEEMNATALDEPEHASEDMREMIEDRDEDNDMGKI